MAKAADREICLVVEGEIDRQDLIELMARYITGGDYAGYLAKCSKNKEEAISA